MNGYVAFYNGKRTEIKAESSYQAQCLAVEHFKPPKSKRHLVHVQLAETDGKPVINTPVD